uniref:Guanylate cyclase n=1 Tax=Rhabditophanes sp. KR3021 TaxID=114890 RepID=A0AC35UDV1_9BILA
MFSLSFLIFLFPFGNSLLNRTTLNLGFLFPKNDPILYELTGFDLSAGAVGVAMDKIKQQQLLPGYNYTYTVLYDECIESQATGMVYDLINKENVDVLFGSTCNMAAIRSAYMTNFYQTPSFLWGLVSASMFLNIGKLPNVVNINPSFTSLGYALVDVMKVFNWTKFNFIYASDRLNRCNNMYYDIIAATDAADYKTYGAQSQKASNPPLDAEFDYFINMTKASSRIIVACFDNDLWKRQFMLRMFDLGLNNNEYVFISVELKNMGWSTNVFASDTERLRFYIDTRNPPDGRDKDAEVIARRTLILDLSKENSDTDGFDKLVLNRIKLDPFYCTSCNTSGRSTASTYARYLHDSILLWANIMNTTIPKYGYDIFTQPSIFNQNCPSDLPGALGNLEFDNNCQRLPYFQLKGLDSKLAATVYFEYNFTSTRGFIRTDFVKDFANMIFENWGSTVPLDVPLCGYLGNSCPVNFFKDYLTLSIIVIFLALLIILFIISLSIYALVSIRRQKRSELLVWKIPHLKLTKPEISKDNQSQSMYSFNSGKTSNTSKNSLINKRETKKFCFLYLDNESLVGQKHSIVIDVNNEEMKLLSEMTRWGHENINKFFGICLDGNKAMSLWKYCRRGSIFEVLQTDNTMFDSFFLMSIIGDIASGIHFLHTSNIGFHGQLSSKHCLVSDRWQIKISNFSLKSINAMEKISTKDKLWLAPEALRHENNYLGSKEGDIYSFAIICSEILTKAGPWDVENRSESVEELIYLVKRGGSIPLRPNIKLAEAADINPAMITLVRDCWKENPTERPNTKQIKTLLKAFNEKGSKNLMDHVFNILEEYAQTLKDEVDDRSQELVEEQRKSDLLLSKMLPAPIAAKLKLGQIVEPEDFESVTILFSDIVQFTHLSNLCRPLQLISMVNELFTLFDNIIERSACYKIESIADGYLVVSGLPIRYETHASECAKLALNFMEGVREFRIPHLPNERVQLRIGLNSGPCVASVVGLSAPRFCLFGDTVNTASRMESHGKPGQIHLTESCHVLLTKLGGFTTEPRGEILVKGKGVMTTYFLHQQIGSTFSTTQEQPPSRIYDPDVANNNKNTNVLSNVEEYDDRASVDKKLTIQQPSRFPYHQREKKAMGMYKEYEAHVQAELSSF